MSELERKTRQSCVWPQSLLYHIPANERDWTKLVHYHSKHETLNRCWFNVGPESETMGHHLTLNVEPRVGWENHQYCFRTPFPGHKFHNWLFLSNVFSKNVFNSDFTKIKWLKYLEISAHFTSKQILPFYSCRAVYCHYFVIEHMQYNNLIIWNHQRFPAQLIDLQNDNYSQRGIKQLAIHEDVSPSNIGPIHCVSGTA